MYREGEIKEGGRDQRTHWEQRKSEREQERGRDRAGSLRGGRERDGCGKR